MKHPYRFVCCGCLQLLLFARFFYLVVLWVFAANVHQNWWKCFLDLLVFCLFACVSLVAVKWPLSTTIRNLWKCNTRGIPHHRLTCNWCLVYRKLWYKMQKYKIQNEENESNCDILLFIHTIPISYYYFANEQIYYFTQTNPFTAYGKWLNSCRKHAGIPGKLTAHWEGMKNLNNAHINAANQDAAWQLYEQLYVQYTEVLKQRGQEIHEYTNCSRIVGQKHGEHGVGATMVPLSLWACWHADISLKPKAPLWLSLALHIC